MDKKWIKWIIYLLAFILYSGLVFIIPHKNTNNLRITYCFSVLAFIVFGVVFYKNVIGKEKERVFLGITPIRLTFVYLILQVATSFVFIHIVKIPSWVVSLSGLVLFCIYLIVILTTMQSIDYIENQNRKENENED